LHANDMTEIAPQQPHHRRGNLRQSETRFHEVAALRGLDGIGDQITLSEGFQKSLSSAGRSLGTDAEAEGEGLGGLGHGGGLAA
jgi:hypothetical protein